MDFVEYKEGEKHASTSPETSDDINAFNDAGLMLADNEVVIDIDHLPKASIEKIISEFNIKTFTVWTDRGVHFYFKKPSESFRRTSQGICRLGFTIEQHTKASRPNGMTIKRNGQLRKFENEDIRQQLPDIFLIPKGKRKIKNDLTGLSEGDGRNEALFKHRAILGNCKDYAKILNFINNYVFAEPMNVKEMESVLREDVDFSTNCDDKYFIAEELRKKYGMVFALGEIWWLQNNEYVRGTDKLRMLVYERCEGEETRYIDEVIKQLNYRVPRVDDTKGFPIRLKNGYVMDGKFYQSKYATEFTPYNIEVDYDENAEPVQIVDDYINQLTANDSDYRLLLMEALGYAMVTDPKKVRTFSKFFFFRGDGANGKGTLLQIMKMIYGEGNCTSLSIKQLSDRTYNASLVGKLCNLGDDVEPSAITDQELKIIKNITTADTITMRPIYKEPFNATLTVKLYFTSNNDLKSYEKGYAYERRVVWLPMFIKVEKPDPQFISKITTPEALKYWIRLIIEGYERLYRNGKWTNADIVKNFNQTYHANNNPTKEYALSLSDDEILGKNIKEIKAGFYEWMGDDTVAFSSKEFKAAVNLVRNFEIRQCWIDGKNKKAYCKKEVFE